MKETFLAAGIILLVLVATSIQSFAQVESQICVCIDKKGNMKFSESELCNPRSSLLCWNAAGTQGLQGEPGESGPAGTQGPQGEPGEPGTGAHVYDSSDPPQYLGNLVGYLPDYQLTSAGSPERLFLVQVFIPGQNKSTYINLRETTSQTAGDRTPIPAKVAQIRHQNGGSLDNQAFEAGYC